MLNKIIDFSLNKKWLIFITAILVFCYGVKTAKELSVDVLPDLTKPTVTILTECAGLAPEEVELQVTKPLETALMGVQGVNRVRSTSDISLSLIFVEFAWGTDIHKARMLVQERIQVARATLPDQAQPYLTPVASLMGEILLIGVHSKDGKTVPTELRSIADWQIRRRLQNIPGIAEVLNMGGGIKQLEIQPDLTKMLALRISHEELEHAAASAASTVTGGFIEQGSQEIMVRNLAMTVDLSEISKTLVKKVGDRIITIGDVANVAWGIEPMRGDASINTHRGVILSVTKAPGYDTTSLTDKITAALDEMKSSLPADVETTVLFQQKNFIQSSMKNLQDSIRDGAIMICVILFLFLLNIRSTVITLVAMPLSFAITLITFRYFGIGVNSMTLGGLAVAMGMVVDDAIVDVENVYRRLRENAALANPLPRLAVIAKASREVRNSIFYATLLIILVFLPLLALTGVEGKLFKPIAIATIISMISSFIVSLTIIPVLCYFLLKPSEKNHGDTFMEKIAKTILRHTFLRVALQYPYLVITAVLLLLITSFSLYPKMGKEFLPPFREETALVSTTAASGTSLTEMNQICDSVEKQILSVPGVKQVGRRIGRAERGDHVVPVSTAEFDVDFQDKRERKEIIAEIQKKIRDVPGTFSVVTTPLADRIGHMLSGVSAPLAIKVFGSDMAENQKVAMQISALAKNIPGLSDVKKDTQSTLPQIRIEPDRERSLVYGISPGDINEQLSTFIGGKYITTLQSGERSIRMISRLPKSLRESTDAILQIPIEGEDGSRVLVSQVANVRNASGPNVIQRENNQRRYVLAIKPTTRDVASAVTELKKQVAENVKLPKGSIITFEGEFQAREEAAQKIMFYFAIVFIIMVVLLWNYLKSLTLTAIILLNIPLALMGSLFLTWKLTHNISIATLVGFIAVGGIAARNGIMMITHYLELMRYEGEKFDQKMIIRGTCERLIPVTMTALCAALALIPLLWSGDEAGKEILYPVAVSIVGGLATSTLLDFAVTPALFFLFGKKPSKQICEMTSYD